MNANKKSLILWLSGASIVFILIAMSKGEITPISPEPAEPPNKYIEFARLHNPTLGEDEENIIAEEVEKCASVSGIDEEIIWSIIRWESGFDPLAISSVGAKGLMQTHSKIWPNTSFDITCNIRQGCSILIHYYLLLDHDLTAALKKYSGGAEGYAEKVLKLAKNIRREYGEKEAR